MADPASLAASARAEATAAFKAADYAKAASLFARAADLGGSEPHALHCNRSAALAALERYGDALEAADAAIALSDGYVKAHYRRALALAALERHADAAAACARAIELNAGAGGSAAVGAQLEALAGKCAPAAAAECRRRRAGAAARRRRCPRRRSGGGGGGAAAALAEENRHRRARAEAEARERDAAERARRAALDEALKEQSEAHREAHAKRRERLREEAAAADGKTVATRAAVAERLVAALDVDGGEGGDGGGDAAAGGSASAAARAAAAQAARVRVESYRVKAMPTRAPLAPPNVPSDFTRQYALLRKDPPGLYGYLKLIAPERCAAIFSPEVPAEVLEAAARCLAEHATADDAAGWVEWLRGLSKAGRFDMTCLMLDKGARAALAAMFDALASRLREAEAADASSIEGRLAPLRKLYLGKE